MSTHELLEEPEFDFDTLRAKLAAWKSAGASRVIFEWNTGPGPTVVYYPAGDRTFAQIWKLPVAATRYGEVYADWLERKLAPRLAEHAKGQELEAKVLCVDQQPIQVMRQRRHEIERAAHAA